MQNPTTAAGAASLAEAGASTAVESRWRTEDWIAVVLGFLSSRRAGGFQWKVADLRNVVPTFRWTTDEQIASLTPAGTRRSTRSSRTPTPSGSRMSWR